MAAASYAPSQRRASPSGMSRFLLAMLVPLVAGCAPSALLDVERTGIGTTGARNTGQFPDIQAAPRRAARQLDAGTYADISSELGADADRAARRPRIDGAAGNRRARRLVAEAEASERRRRARIRRSQAE